MKTDKLLEKIMPAVNVMQENIYIKSITTGMMGTMGVMMASAIFQLIYSFPVEPWTNLLQSIGLYGLLTTVVNICNMTAMFMVFNIGRNLGEMKGVDGTQTGIASLLCFLIITPLDSIEGANYLNTSWLGAQGIFTAMIVAMLACDTVLRWIRIPEESMAYAHDYAMVYFCGSIPVFLYNAISAVLRGMGDSRHPTIFVATAAVLNIVLDLLFVGPMHLECFGAALATVLSQTVAFLLSLIFVYKNREDFCFDFKRKSFTIDRHEFSTLMSLGFPIALQNVAVVISMMFVNAFINAYGVVAAAVTAVGNKLTVLATICTGALNTAGSSIIAQNFAAGKFSRVSRTLLHILLIGLAFCSLLSLVIISFPEQTFALFDTNPEVLAMSRTYAPVAVISLIGFATRSAAMALINGIGFSRLSFVCGILDGIVFRIGLAVLFGMTFGMGVFGYWLGSAVAGHVFTVIGCAYFDSGWWKKRKPITV